MPSHPPLSESPNLTGMIIDGRLRLVDHLGEGSYGIVWLAVDDVTPTSSSHEEPKRYAVKILEKADVGSAQWRRHQREVDAHTRVADHPNIVNIHGVFEDKFFVFIVLEYCEGGDLLGQLWDRHTYARNSDLLKSVFVQILDAVAYCHESGVYHRDLKPDNILTNRDGSVIKLTDFGLCTHAQVSDTFRCGSSYYMSPECIGDDYDYHPYSTAVNDVWSLGVILANLAGGRNPWGYASSKDKSYLKYLADSEYLRQHIPVSEECADILKAIFNPDPVARITIPELRERILAVETFFMSEEEIMNSGPSLQLAAAAYKLFSSEEEAEEQLARSQSIVSEEDARALLAYSSSSGSGWGSSPGSSYSSDLSEIIEVKLPDVLAKPPLPRRRTPVRHASNPEIAKFVIAPSDGLSDSASSSRESKGPVTPLTQAEDASKLAEVPDFGESEKLGEAVVSLAPKHQPIEQLAPEPAAIPVAA